MIYIGNDHGGLELKNEVLKYIKDDLKMEITDMGCYDNSSVDYPDYAEAVCKKVLENNGTGILICGTGIGISIAANKIDGIRCALCHESYSAEMTRRHNNSNVLAMGGRVTGPELAKSIVKAYLTSEFEGGRHQKRVEKISALEQK